MRRQRETHHWEKELRHFPVHPQGIPSSLKRKVEERIAMNTKPNRKLKVWISCMAAAAALFLIVMLREPLMDIIKPEVTLTEEKFDSVTERTLKVQVFHRDTFMRQYGEAYVIKHPNMTIEAIETMGMSTTESDSKVQADVLYLPITAYRQMAQEGLLYPLDAFIQKDRYDLEAFRPGIIPFLRESEGGKLYGLAATFSGQAIYFNKDLFNRYSIPYPTDQMSWEQLLQLAAR
ncbi:MAG: hypothetical protein K0R67_3616, partial [Paenibacillus sp.]|nr:hypothetical protein [Paenibacillus sp.]